MFLRDAIFAFSEAPISRHRRHRKLADERASDLRERIMDADGERAKGVMSSLSRGSGLLQLEKVYSGVRGNERPWRSTNPRDRFTKPAGKLDQLLAMGNKVQGRLKRTEFSVPPKTAGM